MLSFFKFHSCWWRSRMNHWSPFFSLIHTCTNIRIISNVCFNISSKPSNHHLHFFVFPCILLAILQTIVSDVPFLLPKGMRCFAIGDTLHKVLQRWPSLSCYISESQNWIANTTNWLLKWHCNKEVSYSICISILFWILP